LCALITLGREDKLLCSCCLLFFSFEKTEKNSKRFVIQINEMNQKKISRNFSIYFIVSHFLCRPPPLPHRATIIVIIHVLCVCGVICLHTKSKPTQNKQQRHQQQQPTKYFERKINSEFIITSD
jgi:hypothetical protein